MENVYDPDDTLSWYKTEYRMFENQKKVDDETIQQRIKQLGRFREWLGVPFEEATASDIKQVFADRVDDGYQPTTLSNYRAALSKLYWHLERDGRIDENPLDDIAFGKMSAASASTTAKEIESERGKRIHPLTQEQVEDLIENVPSPKVRNELLIRLMVQTGMRAGEVEHLKLENIDWDNREIEIDESKSEPRTISYAPSLSFLLDQWVNGGHRDTFDTAGDSPYLFVSLRKERLRSNVINKVVVKAAKNAGIQEELYEDAQGGRRWKLTSHALRHTFAVASLKPDVGEGQANLAYLRDMMGHTDISVTQEYLKYIEDDALEEMKRCQPRF